MANYTSTFESLKHDTISITISGESLSGGSLILNGSEPVCIEYNQDDVFSPLKKSTCTVSVITDIPMLNLFTGKVTDIKISVERNGTTIWFGFLSPNVYSMPYDSKNNQLSLEFVCPLTAMEDVKFKYFGDKFFAKFSEYISQALSAVGASFSVEGIPSELADVGCMQRNYIDETNDDKDGAMSWSEVLESILRYMNKTATCYGNKLIIYDALTNGTAKNFSSIGAAANDGSISLSEIYNKVTVIANNNALDSSIPDILNEKDFTAQDDSEQYHQVEYFADQNQWGERSSLHTEDDDTTKYLLMNAAYRSMKWALSGQFEAKKHPVGWYGSDIGINQSDITTSYPTSVPWADMLQFSNVLPAGTAYASNGTSYYSLQTTHIKGSFLQRYASVEKKGVTSSLTWSKCLTLASVGAKASLTDKPFFVGQGGYFILSVSYLMSFWAYPQSVVMGFDINKEDFKPLKCMLRVGNKYLYKNGSTYEWRTTESYFEIKHTQEDAYTTGTEVSIDNEVSWSDGLNTSNEGYKIPLPAGEVLSGDVYFSIENINNNVGTSVCPYYYHITELSLQYASSTEIKDIFSMDEYDADIKYSGQIDDENVAEFSDVEFTTNTYTDRATSASYAIKLANGKYSYHVPTTIPEKVCIQRLVEHYCMPKMTYQITLDNTSGNYISPNDRISVQFLGKTFAVGSVTYNLDNNSAEVTLLEV